MRIIRFLPLLLLALAYILLAGWVSHRHGQQGAIPTVQPSRQVAS